LAARPLPTGTQPPSPSKPGIQLDVTPKRADPTSKKPRVKAYKKLQVELLIACRVFMADEQSETQIENRTPQFMRCIHPTAQLF
jgi:hypothetical protein